DAGAARRHAQHHDRQHHRPAVRRRLRIPVRLGAGPGADGPHLRHRRRDAALRQAAGDGMTRRDPVKLALGAWTGAVLLFLFAPLVIVAVFSVNDSMISRFPMSGLTLGWYRKLFGNAALHVALGNSLIIAFATVVVS